MATAKNARKNLIISENEFADFIEVNRKAICNEEMLGIRVLARLVEESFLDVMLYLEEDKDFIIARFSLKNLYFLGYAKCGKTIWYTLSQLEETSSSASKSKKKIQKLKKVSIKDKKTMKWEEKHMEYTGGYCGSETMMAIAGGGAGNAKKQPKELKDMKLGQQYIHHEVQTLLKNDPVDQTDPKLYAMCAQACAVIALTIAEPLRFEFLKAKIVEEWAGGYRLCATGIFLIKNWDAFSLYVKKHKNMKADQDILEGKGHITNFLKDEGIKTTDHLKNLFGIILDNTEIKAPEEDDFTNGIRAQDKSKGKRS